MDTAFKIWICVFLIYLTICVYVHNRRLEDLEEKIKKKKDA